MSLRKSLIITAIWTVLIIAVGGVGIWYVGTHRVPGARAEARASKLGSGLGVLASIGYACIWLPYAAKIGKKRREERDQAQKQKAKRKRPR